MHRSEPVANKIVSQKWRDQSYTIHREKLSTIKSSIDNKPPKALPHIQKNLKKQQNEKERLQSIRKDNHKLLTKMTDIMKKNYLDNKNQSIQYSKSLNNEHRKKELMRITAENHAILKRIQHRQPVYNHLKWEHERKQNESYCKNICEYEYMNSSTMNSLKYTKNRRDLQMDRKHEVLTHVHSRPSVYSGEEEEPEDEYYEHEMETTHDEYFEPEQTEEEVQLKKQEDEVINQLLQEHDMEPLTRSETLQDEKNSDVVMESDENKVAEATRTQDIPQPEPQPDSILEKEKQVDHQQTIDNTDTTFNEKQEVVRENNSSSDTNKDETTTPDTQNSCEVNAKEETVQPNSIEVMEPKSDDKLPDNHQQIMSESQEEFNFDDDPLDNLEDFEPLDN